MQQATLTIVSISIILAEVGVILISGKGDNNAQSAVLLLNCCKNSRFPKRGYFTKSQGLLNITEERQRESAGLVTIWGIPSYAIDVEALSFLKQWPPYVDGT